jgi:quercetin dioxygenase-like cupin family protein
MTRTAELQTLVDSLAAAFAEADVSAAGRAALERVFARLKNAGTAGTASAGEPLPVTGLFDQALAPLLNRSDALAPLARALQALFPHLTWVQRKVGVPNASEGFAEAHANAMLIGPQGVERRDDVQIGLSLMAPRTRYPDHNHPPEEVYIVLSDGAFLQTAPPWLPRKPGETVYNTPGILHAMRAGDAPFLALWCLPV